MLFIIVNLSYLILPFGFARLHFQLSRGKFELAKLNFMYFLFFNVFLKGVPIALSALVRGHFMAETNGWAFSPIYAQYGISIGAIGLLGLFAIFIRGTFRLAAALAYALFSLFAAITHIVQVAQGVPLRSHNSTTLIFFDLLTALMLFFFIINPKARGKI